MRMFLYVAVLCIGCGSRFPNEDAIRDEDAGKVALGCLEQMIACEDWTPINVASHKKKLPVPECEGYDPACEKERALTMAHNREIDSIPLMRSPCQQKIDTCVELVAALVGAPAQTEIHHHKD